MSTRPRIRSIKPEAWQDEKVGALSRDARLLMVGLITMADDEGRLRAQPSMIIGHVFPWDDVAPRKLAEWLTEIEDAGVVLRYEEDGRQYVAFRHWRRHQQINKPSTSVLPPPPDSVVVEENRPRPKLEGSAVDGEAGYKKRAIPQATRRAVARRHGAEPGETTRATCESCGTAGSIYWPRVRSGKPGSWVQFVGLELDHVNPEAAGGSDDPGNVALLCVNCNRRKGSRLPVNEGSGITESTTTNAPRKSGSESCSPARADRIGSDRIGSDRIGSDRKGTEKHLPPAVAAEQEDREEVIGLCDLLADLIQSNDPKAKVAPDSKRWRDAMRLLLDADGRTAEEVERVIRWSQADDFWRTNILSASKLRDQFGQLWQRATNGTGPSRHEGPTAADFLALRGQG